MDDVLNLAQVKAELSYLNRLDERREANVANLKRLKQARDALLGRRDEAAGSDGRLQIDRSENQQEPINAGPAPASRRLQPRL
jgi:hypothetical protein